MSDQFSEVIAIFETYLKILEEPSLIEKKEMQDLMKAYDCCEFIESFIPKIREREKEEDFEKYLNHKLNSTYKCSDFENTRDKMLEILMKDNRVSTKKVDLLFNIYVQRYGQESLKNFLDKTVKDAMCFNLILNSLVEQRVPVTKLQDEAIFFMWDKQVYNGNILEVNQSIDNMLDDQHILKLINAVLNSKLKSKTKNLIMGRLTSRAFENDEKFFQEIIKIDPSLLIQVLEGNANFCTNFLDTVLYFGRSMVYEDGNWVSDKGVQYKDIAKIVRTLLTESNEIGCQMQRLLNIAKELDGDFWEEIQRDCIRFYSTENDVD